MVKVSIGLRGWRFDEEDVLDGDELKPLREMPPDARERVSRLAVLYNNPCDCCWLIHGEENKRRCNVARVVYGEPVGEVLLCNEHEPDFLYWFREERGHELAGDRLLQNAFHQWFADGGSAPDEYEGTEHVDTDPEGLPDPDTQRDLPSLEEEIAEMSDDELAALDVDLSDLDIERTGADGGAGARDPLDDLEGADLDDDSELDADVDIDGDEDIDGDGDTDSDDGLDS